MMVPALALSALLAATAAGAAPASAGSVDPFRAPAPEALRLNAEGTALYRQAKWDEARARFRAALDADPSYLPPLLNVACSFVRQQRFDDALATVQELLRRGGPVPWTREVQEAADLGALLARPGAGRLLRDSLATAAESWGQGLQDAVLLVARLAEPLKLPADGVAVLAPRQELFAWLPREQLYRRLSAEDGHVVAAARSPDGSRVLYVVADKAVRERGHTIALRGVTVREMVLRNVSSGPAQPLAGDVRLLSVAFRRGEFVLSLQDGQGTRALALHDGRLQPVEPVREPPLLVLRPGGADAPRPLRPAGACPLTVREVRRPAGAPAVEARPCKAPKPIVLGPPLGASLTGLPLE